MKLASLAEQQAAAVIMALSEPHCNGTHYIQRLL